MLSQVDFERLYQAKERALFNIALRWTWDEAQAAEMVQDAFLKLWQKRLFVRLETAPAYVTKMVLRLGQNHARRRERWGKVKRLVGQATSIVDQPESALASTQLQNAIRQLSEAQRSVLLLTEFSGLSQKDVADILNIPMGTVGSRRDAAMRNLKECLT